MHPRPSAFSAWRAAVAGLLVLQLLCVLALAAMPAWHEWVHPEAGACHHEDHDAGEKHHHQEHECAVTLFLSGACDCAPAPVLAGAPVLVGCPELLDRDFPSVVFTFRSRGIFEHAPPRRA